MVIQVSKKKHKKEFNEISVNKILRFFLFFLLISNCSLNSESSLWTKSKKIEAEKDLIVKELFKDEEARSKEINSNLKIKLESNFLENNFNNNLKNNSGRINYNGKLESISKYKFSKIDNFDQFEPEIIFDKNNIVFFDNKGSILKFDQFSKLIWEKNYYTKAEKKLKPKLSLANNDEILIVADNLAKYYSVNLKSGKLLWSKTNLAPFNSQIKIYKDMFFITDFENVLRCFSIKNGNELWNVKTDTTFIKSQKKLSLVISNEVVFFSNSIGDISAVDISTGNLIWQTPTQSSSIYEDAFLLKTSDIIVGDNEILFSNNKNEFFSLDVNSGALNWVQKINSSLRPTIIENLIFTVSIEGYLAVVEKENGNIVRFTDVFDKFNKKKRPNIKPVGFLAGSKNIYLTTDSGQIIIIEILNGKSSSILKIDNEKLSRPFILNQNLFVIKDNAIIKLN